MTLEPTSMDRNGDFDERPLQTLRAWAKEPYSIMSSQDNDMESIYGHICQEGLGNAVREIITLEDAPPPAKDRIPDGRPENSILVDLAVVAGEMERVTRYFAPVESPLSDVSLVSLPVRLDSRKTEPLIRNYHVHSRYMRQYIWRKDISGGELPAPLFHWYDGRFEELVLVEGQASNQD